MIRREWDQRLLKLIAVQAGPAAYLVRFGLVALYDVLNEGASVFIAFSVASALQRGFMMAASLRARLILLSTDEADSHYTPLLLMVFVGGLVGVLASIGAGIGSGYIGLVIPLALSRWCDNLIAPLLSHKQIQGNRDDAILFAFWQSAASASPYFLLFASIGLRSVLWVELLVLAAFASRSFLIRSTAQLWDRAVYALLARRAALFTVASLLNSLIATSIVWLLLRLNSRHLAADAAVFFAAAGMFARLVTSAALFFRARTDEFLAWLARPTPTGGITVVGTLVLLVLGQRSERVGFWWLTIVCLGLVNVIALLYRQSLTLSGYLPRLIRMHSIELIVVVFATYLVVDTRTLLLVLLTVWQVLRLVTLSAMVRSGSRESKSQ